MSRTKRDINSAGIGFAFVFGLAATAAVEPDVVGAIATVDLVFLGVAATPLAAASTFLSAWNDRVAAMNLKGLMPIDASTMAEYQQS